MQIALVALVGYLLGSVPFAYLLARQRGIDLRKSGSGNIGAANVLRTVGVSTAVIVGLLDALKGAVAVLGAQAVTSGTVAPVAAGLASIVGHVYPVWLQFRGGKGVATSAGVFAVLAPTALGLAAIAFVIVVVVTRFVSAGSVVAAITLVVVTAIVTDAPGPVVAGAVGAALIVLARHHGNLRRLVSGSERRIGMRPFGR
jgi:acyl phosphate:glycerol-3-phosphate acyltransferase